MIMAGWGNPTFFGRPYRIAHYAIGLAISAMHWHYAPLDELLSHCNKAIHVYGMTNAVTHMPG